MGIATRTRKVVDGTGKAVKGTIEAGHKAKDAAVWTGEATVRNWHRAGSALTWLAATVPGAAVVVAGANVVSRSIKHVDFFPHMPADFVPNAIDWGHDHAVSLLDSSNVASQAGGVLVGAESTAAQLADMASTPGEAVGGVVGDIFGGEELGAEIGGGVSEAAVVAGAGRVAWKLSRAAANTWPSRPAPTPGH